MATVEERLVKVESEVGHLKDQTVFKQDIATLLTPMQNDLLLQGESIKQLAKDMSELSESSIKTNTTVDSLLRTYEKSLLDREKAWGLPNVFKVTVMISGGITGIAAACAVVYAIIKFVFFN